MEKKKIVIFSQYYAPDFASTGQLMTDLAEGLTDVFDVTVVSAVPENEPDAPAHELLNGVNVYRFLVTKINKKSKLSRIKGISSFYEGAKRVAKKLGKFDIVFCLSQPQLLGGRLGRWAKKRFSAKLVYCIEDFCPESIKALGMSKNKLLLSALMSLDKKNCAQSDLVITVGRDLVDTLKQRFKNKNVPNHAMINNWIDESEVFPLDPNDERVVEFRAKNGFDNDYLFVYSGNIGLFYDLPNLFKAISELPRDLKTVDGRNVRFVFIGEGGSLAELQNIAAENQMKNVSFLPYQNKRDLVVSLNSADVHFCFSAKGFKGVSCPSKYYGIAACSKPVLGVMDKGSEIRIIVEETNGGLCSDPEDYDSFKNNVSWFVNNSNSVDAEEMGRRAYENLKCNLSAERSISKYKEALLSLF